MDHVDLPMRLFAGKWKIINSRLLPMIEQYGHDKYVYIVVITKCELFYLYLYFVKIVFNA